MIRRDCNKHRFTEVSLRLRCEVAMFCDCFCVSMLKLELWVGQMVGANMCRLNNGKNGSCFCTGLQVEIWVRPMGLIGRGERLVAKGKGKGCGH